MTICYFPQQVGVELRPGGFLALAVPFLFKPVAYLGKGAAREGCMAVTFTRCSP